MFSGWLCFYCVVEDRLTTAIVVENACASMQREKKLSLDEKGELAWSPYLTASMFASGKGIWRTRSALEIQPNMRIIESKE